MMTRIVSVLALGVLIGCVGCKSNANTVPMPTTVGTTPANEPMKSPPNSPTTTPGPIGGGPMSGTEKTAPPLPPEGGSMSGSSGGTGMGVGSSPMGGSGTSMGGSGSTSTGEDVPPTTGGGPMPIKKPMGDAGK